MTRQISILTASLLAVSTITSADVVVNTNSYNLDYIESDEVLAIELKEFFQVYSGEGPIADFTINLPVQDGLKDLEYNTTHNSQGQIEPLYTGNTVELMTYKLLGGGSYDHVYGASASEFEWHEVTVQYQLLANDAPVTVANFIQYISEGQYENLVIHRRIPGVIQAGSLRIWEGDDFIFDIVERRNPIEYEGGTIDNSIGSLSLALGNSVNSGSSDFFINLQDNTASYGSYYPVFGQLMNQETSLPLLQEMGRTWVYNLQEPYFSNLQVSTIPLYSPFWEDKESFVSIKSITIPPGNPEGVSYSYEWLDQDGDPENLSDEEAANQAAFNISITGSTLSISSNDSGIGILQLNGSIGGDNDAKFTIPLIAYNEEGYTAFLGASITQDGILNSPWYGQLNAMEYPLLKHATHGYQHVGQYETDAFGTRTFFIYDYGLESWLWTDTFYYPLLYAYDLEGDATWLYSVVETGNGSTIPRWFYNLNTGDWMSNYYGIWTEDTSGN